MIFEFFAHKCLPYKKHIVHFLYMLLGHGQYIEMCFTSDCVADGRVCTLAI